MTDATMHDLGPGAPVSAALRVAVVAPYERRGGRGTAHSTRVARHLADAGHEVTLLLWAHQPPTAPAAMDWSSHARSVPSLHRTRPGSWVQAGRQLRGFDSIVVVHCGPLDATAHLCLLRAAGALPGRPGSFGSGPRSIVAALRPLTRPSRSPQSGLAASLLAGCDAVLVHDQAQAGAARQLGARRVSLADLPPTDLGADLPEPGGWRNTPGSAILAADLRSVRLLLLLLRPNADRLPVERLLRAVGAVPGIALTIAVGPFGPHQHLASAIATDAALVERVSVHDGPVPEPELARLLAAHDVLVLPPTGGLEGDEGDGLALARSHGLAVLAPDVAPFSQQVTDGVDGLLVPPESETALADALRRLREPALHARLSLGLDRPDLDGRWAHYLGALESLSVDTRTPDAPATGGHPLAGSASRLTSVRRVLRRGTSRAEQAHRVVTDLATVFTRRRVVDLRTPSIPAAVLATDVLSEPGEADEARRLAVGLGLPRTHDRVGSWAALGALAAILRVLDDGGRRAVVVDEGGSRSLFTRWARTVGFAPIALGFTGLRPRLAALEVDAGSLDAVVRVHPRGCDATDVDVVLEQASWALHPRGLLVVTVPIGPPGAEGVLGPADVRGVLARADGLGFALVGDLDGDVNDRMRAAATRARTDDAAYGLVRLTLRRR